MFHPRRDAEALGGEVLAQAAEAGNDLVENEQDAVARADLAQPLQVAHRRHDHAGGALHGLDHDGGDGGGIVQGHQPLQLIGQMGAPTWLAAREGHVRPVVGGGQVIRAAEHDGREHLAVGADAAEGYAPHADAVVGALAADHAHARSLAAHGVVAQGDLEGGVHRLGARVGEEHVIQPLGRHRRDALRQAQGSRIAELEGGAVVQGFRLALERLDDARMAVAQGAAPQPRQAVEQAVAVGALVIGALGRNQDARLGVLLEIAVGREGQPAGLGVEALRGAGIGCGCRHLAPPVGIDRKTRPILPR